MKPIYKIVLITGLIIIVGIALFLAWKKISPEAPPEEPITGFPIAPEDGEEEVPTAPVFQLTKLSDDEVLVFDFWQSPQTGEVYYLTLDGGVLNAKKGPDPEVSTQSIAALNFIKISPDSKKLLVAFGDPKNPGWRIFDVLDGVWRPLTISMVHATWGETSNELIGIQESEKGRNLVRVNLSQALLGDSSNTFEIVVESFQLRDVTLAWLPLNKVIITEKPASFYGSRTWELDLETLEFNLLSVSEWGIITEWVRDNDVVFKFSPPSQFFILNRNLANIIPVFFTSLPSKCDVDDLHIYCFAPQEFPPELPDLQLPDDYLQKRFYTIDDFFVMERVTGEINHIFRSYTGDLSAIDAEKLRVFDGVIYFINRYDQGLYELKLL